MNDVTRRYSAEAMTNGDFIYISTWSGYRSNRRDHRGVQYLLKPDASNADIGAAVIDALSHSRFVLANPAQVAFHPPSWNSMPSYSIIN